MYIQLKSFVFILAVFGWPLNFHFMFDLMLLSAVAIVALSFFLPKSIEHKREPPPPSLPTSPPDLKSSTTPIEHKREPPLPSLPTSPLDLKSSTTQVPLDDIVDDSELLLAEELTDSNDSKHIVIVRS